jgi:hypothetical protein
MLQYVQLFIYATARDFLSNLKAARLQIHSIFNKNFENVYKGKIL